MSFLVVLVVSALAGARLWRLFAVDAAGWPLRSLYFGLIPNKWFGVAADGANCPFCMGFWITSAVFASGLAWSDTWGWKLVAGVFAANYIGAQLNAWLDNKPITDGGGEINAAEEALPDAE